MLVPQPTLLMLPLVLLLLPLMQLLLRPPPPLLLPLFLLQSASSGQLRVCDSCHGAMGEETQVGSNAAILARFPETY